MAKQNIQKPGGYNTRKKRSVEEIQADIDGIQVLLESDNPTDVALAKETIQKLQKELAASQKVLDKKASLKKLLTDRTYKVPKRRTFGTGTRPPKSKPKPKSEEAESPQVEPSITPPEEKPAKKRGRPKATPAPKEKETETPAQPEHADLSWAKDTRFEELFEFGRVFELEIADGCSRRVGVLLAKKASIYVKGNAIVHATKGDLVEMVELPNRPNVFRQFNLIGNAVDKCRKKTELFLDGSSEQTKPEFTEADKKETYAQAEAAAKSEAVEVEAEIEAMEEVLHTNDDQFGENAPKKAQEAVAELKKKAVKNPEHYTDHSAGMKVVAQIVFGAAMALHSGITDQLIGGIYRRGDGRIVLAMYEATRKKGDFLATGQAKYFLLQEKSRRLTATDAPDDKANWVDGKKETIVVANKARPQNSFLDVVYGNPHQVEKCLKIEEKVRECQAGNCTTRMKKSFELLAKHCKHNEKQGIQKHLQRYTQDFHKLFSGASAGKKLWDYFK